MKRLYKKKGQVAFNGKDKLAMRYELDILGIQEVRWTADAEKRLLNENMLSSKMMVLEKRVSSYKIASERLVSIY